MGLGMVSHATTTHIKVSIKDDNLGLGSKLKRKEKKDEFDSGECAGLDVFQRILGRLNGKEDIISNELEKQRKNKIINGKWGINFVKGEVLASTWDAETKALKVYSNDVKRKRQYDDVDKGEMRNEKHKKHKKHKKEKKEGKEKKEKKEKKVTRESMLKPRDSAAIVPDTLSTRLSVRSKWIKQKRAAVMDAKALNEIFMVTN